MNKILENITSEKRSIPVLYNDKVFKAVFMENTNILAKMIADIIGIDYKLLYDNVVLLYNEVPITKSNQSTKRCDFVIRINDDNIISLELNSYYQDWLYERNFEYVSSMYRKRNKSDNFVLTQINLDVHKPLKKYKNIEDLDKCIIVYTVSDKNNNKLINNFQIINIDVVNSYYLLYNLSRGKEAPKILKWASFVGAKSIKEINYILGDMVSIMEKEHLNQVVKGLDEEVYKLTDKEIEDLLEWEEQQRINKGMKLGIEQGMKQGLEQGLEQGMKQGIEQGIEQTQKETINKMLSKNLSIEEISNLLDIDISKINEIIKK